VVLGENVSRTYDLQALPKLCCWSFANAGNRCRFPDPSCSLLLSEGGIRPLSAQALFNLLDRKPHLLRPLVLQLLPPPLAPIDPAERLGIDL
jgi:hypothetical protein